MSKSRRSQPRRKNDHAPVSDRAAGGALLARILALPRMARIVIVALLALAAVLVASPVVDTVYLRYFYTPETVIVPSLVTAALGLLAYLAGWRLIVGTVGVQPESSRAAQVYLIAGGLLVVAAGVWLLRLIVML